MTLSKLLYAELRIPELMSSAACTVSLSENENRDLMEKSRMLPGLVLKNVACSNLLRAVTLIRSLCSSSVVGG